MNEAFTDLSEGHWRPGYDAPLVLKVTTRIGTRYVEVPVLPGLPPVSPSRMKWAKCRALASLAPPGETVQSVIARELTHASAKVVGDWPEFISVVKGGWRGPSGTSVRRNAEDIT